MIAPALRVLALEIHFQRQIRDRAGLFQLSFYAVPIDVPVIGEEMRVGVSAIVVQVYGEKPVSVPGEAVGVRMVEVLVPAVVAKTEPPGWNLRVDSVKMRDAVEVFDGEVDLHPLRVFHEPFDAVHARLCERRAGGKARDVHDGGRNAEPAAIAESGAKGLQVYFPLRPIFPQRVRVAVGRMHVVDLKPKPPGQLRLAVLFGLIRTAPPERHCAEPGLPDHLQALFDGQGIAEPGEYPKLNHNAPSLPD